MSDARIQELRRTAKADPAARAALNAELARAGLPIEHGLNGYDWDAMWSADEHRDGPPAFQRDDIAEVVGTVQGANDGRRWVTVVRLRDGRFGLMQGSCDYTGWG